MAPALPVTIDCRYDLCWRSVTLFGNYTTEDAAAEGVLVYFLFVLWVVSAPPKRPATHGRGSTPRAYRSGHSIGWIIETLTNVATGRRPVATSVCTQDALRS